MLTFIHFEDTNVVGIQMDDKVTEQDFDQVIARFNQKLERYEKMRLYIEMEYFGGVELQALYKDLKFGLKNFKNFEKEVVVTNKKWMQQLVKISNPLVPWVEVKAFPFTEKEEAKKMDKSLK